LRSGGDRGRILYLSHNGLTEPLGRRQVLPYVVGLASRNFELTVVSFEKAETAVPEAVARVNDMATAARVRWKPLRYHNRPRLVGTLVDIVQGLAVCLPLARHNDLIHARSTVPAFIARLTSRITGKPWIFDLRGLLAQEYVDAGHWRQDGWVNKWTAGAELELLRTAPGLVTLTHRVVSELPPSVRAAHGRPTAVVPCSVDLGVFQPSEAWRREVRMELGWGDERVLVYSGSLGSWYQLGEMLDFFEAASESIDGLRFLLLTPHVALAQPAVQARRLESRVIVRQLGPEAVPRFLAAADAGICFLGRYPSKIASSPTKYAEYLAAGLPVVTNGWIGDAARLAGEAPWILVDEFSRSAYQQAAASLSVLLATPGPTRAACRTLATREFGLEAAIARYEALYRQVLSR
jgi:glycosyltransferase involved in cell wall biosynthesis